MYQEQRTQRKTMFTKRAVIFVSSCAEALYVGRVKNLQSAHLQLIHQQCCHICEFVRRGIVRGSSQKFTKRTSATNTPAMLSYL